MTAFNTVPEVFSFNALADALCKGEEIANPQGTVRFLIKQAQNDDMVSNYMLLKGSSYIQDHD